MVQKKGLSADMTRDTFQEGTPVTCWHIPVETVQKPIQIFISTNIEARISNFVLIHGTGLYFFLLKQKQGNLPSAPEVHLT